jgi:hypothetical protein
MHRISNYHSVHSTTTRQTTAQRYNFVLNFTFTKSHSRFLHGIRHVSTSHTARAPLSLQISSINCSSPRARHTRPSQTLNSTQSTVLVHRGAPALARTELYIVVVAIAALRPDLNTCPLAHALVVALDNLRLITSVKNRNDAVAGAGLGALGLVVVEAVAALGVGVGALGGGDAFVVAGDFLLGEGDGGHKGEEEEEGREDGECELHFGWGVLVLSLVRRGKLCYSYSWWEWISYLCLRREDLASEYQSNCRTVAECKSVCLDCWMEKKEKRLHRIHTALYLYIFLRSPIAIIQPHLDTSPTSPFNLHRKASS